MTIFSSRTRLLFAALVASSLGSYAAVEGYNECLQKEMETDGVLGPADQCTPDAEGTVGLHSCKITDDDHEALTACLSIAPSTIIKLTLDDNSFHSLPEGLFLEMSYLREMSLFENRGISELPLGVFAGLKRLKHLDISWMSLKSVQVGLFDDTFRLQILKIGSQHFGFTELPDGIFGGLKRLRVLSLYENSLTTLPANIFSSNSRLSTLILDENDITSLPENIFQSTPRLHTIRLSSNSLTVLPVGLLAGLKKLKYVSFNVNILTTLPENLFEDTWRLKYIHVKRNSLVELPEDTFLDLPSLISLDISENPDLQCKYEVDPNVDRDNIDWPEHLDGLSPGECVP